MASDGEIWNYADLTIPMAVGVTQNVGLTQAMLKGQGYVSAKEPIRMDPILVTPTPGAMASGVTQNSSLTQAILAGQVVKKTAAAPSPSSGVVLPIALGIALLLFAA